MLAEAFELDLESPADRIRPLIARGNLRLWDGDLAAAQTDFRQVLAECRQPPDPLGAAEVLWYLAEARPVGRPPAGRAYRRGRRADGTGGRRGALLTSSGSAAPDWPSRRQPPGRAAAGAPVPGTRPSASGRLACSTGSARRARRRTWCSRRCWPPGLLTAEAEWSRVDGPSDPGRWAAAPGRGKRSATPGRRRTPAGGRPRRCWPRGATRRRPRGPDPGVDAGQHARRQPAGRGDPGAGPPRADRASPGSGQAAAGAGRPAGRRQAGDEARPHLARAGCAGADRRGPRPTARSPRRCSSAPGPSPCTCPASWPSSACPTAAGPPRSAHRHRLSGERRPFRRRRDGYQGEPDQQGDAVRDDQPHVAGRYPVGDPEHEAGEQDRRSSPARPRARTAGAACGGSAGPGRGPSARPRQEAEAARSDTNHGIPSVRRPGLWDRARQ